MSIYDHGAKPVNKLAAIVVAGGEHYEPKNKPLGLHFENMPELPELPDSHSLKVQLVAMIGKRQGRLVVIAWWSQGDGRKTARWLCRCDCGEFTVRTGKAMKNPKNEGDRCYKCMDLVYLRRRNDRRVYINLDITDRRNAGERNHLNIDEPSSE